MGLCPEACFYIYNEMKKFSEMKFEDKILWILGAVCLLLFCIGGFLLLDYFMESHKQEEMNEELSRLKHGYASDTFVIVEAEPLDGNTAAISGDSRPGETDAAERTDAASSSTILLHELNPDYIFWLQIPETAIDYPVVYRDNDYYLRRDFYGEKNKHGTIFLDAGYKEEDTFLLLHGHNMKDGTMFGSLRSFKDREFRTQHKELILSWEKENVQFQIVAGVVVDLYNTDRFAFEKLPRTQEDAEQYFANLKKCAVWYDAFEWEYGKRVVLLSTCDYSYEESRFVVFAVEK